ncbi:MAG: 16S rRNA (adenine1518-N6/adenine1519-N6)-dimethyltransferase [Microgenomates group bacterium Gr01-1014_16]|nr:MAG: 16S rRNA (adenine1518-N6/adenine1519-N6)-dimethyltransferase [Microgenomates group bacterium Gr01-1014_16]
MAATLWHSQNFIGNPSLVSKLLGMTDINSSDFVIEIGPGKGAITGQLVRSAGSVLAIEADLNLANKLNIQNVKVIQGDFLKHALPDQVYKVVANIPFNLTAEIIRKLFLSDENKPEAAFLIMQNEAAQKFAGVPKATLSSILIQVEYDTRILTKIDKGEFVPTSKVDAAFISFIKRGQPLVNRTYSREFADFVAYGYKYFRWNEPLISVFDRLFTNSQKENLEKKFQLTGQKVSDLEVFKWIGLFNDLVDQVATEKWDIFRGTMEKLTEEQSRLQKRHKTQTNLGKTNKS